MLIRITPAELLQPKYYSLGTETTSVPSCPFRFHETRMYKNVSGTVTNILKVRAVAHIQN
jgi:hypothetical protein